MALNIVYFLVSLQVSSYLVQAKPNVYRDEDIVPARMPPECEHKTFCFSKAADYPLPKIKEIMSGLTLYGLDTVEPTNRQGEGDATDQICHASKNYDPIYQIVDKNDDVRYVVQVDGIYQHTYFVVECMTGRVCEPGGVFQSTSLDHYNVTCEQVSIEQQFLVLTKDMKNVELVYMKDKLPVACSCKYSRIDNYEPCPKVTIDYKNLDIMLSDFEKESDYY